MNHFLKFGFFIVLILVFACKSENKSTIAVADVDNSPEIPGIPQDVMEKLLDECTFVDYIFRDLPFSLSQSEPQAIKSNIAFIDYTRPLGHIPKNCTPDGRKFFQIKGEIVYDVDVYILGNCHFYVFVDEANKPIYANYITQAGVNFYNDVINQATQMNPSGN